jgi:hypothetical protein
VARAGSDVCLDATLVRAYLTIQVNASDTSARAKKAAADV